MDVEELKQAHRATWAAGDYPSVAEMIMPSAVDLVEQAEVAKGLSVLDVATGSGNVAIPAAERGAKVVGLDLTPELFTAARQRAKSAGVKVEWLEGDAEELPFEDKSFDRVLSAFGVMFAPRHRRAAGELVRVLKPDGLIGLCNWTPEGVVGQIFKISSAYLPKPPDYVMPPSLWGSERHVRELLVGSGLELSFERKAAVIVKDSPDDLLKMMETNFGPLVRAKETLDAQHWAEMRAELLDLYTSSNKADEDEGLLIEQEYLLVLARPRS